MNIYHTAKREDYKSQIKLYKNFLPLYRTYWGYILGCIMFLAIICTHGCILRPEHNYYYFDYSTPHNISVVDIETSISQVLTPIADDYQMNNRWRADNQIVFMAFANSIIISYEPQTNRIILKANDIKDSSIQEMVDRIGTGLDDLGINYTVIHEVSRGSLINP